MDQELMSFNSISIFSDFLGTSRRQRKAVAIKHVLVSDLSE
jgi:hypothetical protein